MAGKSELWDEEFWKKNVKGAANNPPPIQYIADHPWEREVIGHTEAGEPIELMSDEEFQYVASCVDDDAMVEIRELKDVLLWLRDCARHDQYMGAQSLRLMAERLMRWVNSSQKYVGKKWMQ